MPFQMETAAVDDRQIVEGISLAERRLRQTPARPPSVVITALAATKGLLKIGLTKRPPTEAALAQLFFNCGYQLPEPLLSLAGSAPAAIRRACCPPARRSSSFSVALLHSLRSDLLQHMTEKHLEWLI